MSRTCIGGIAVLLALISFPAVGVVAEGEWVPHRVKLRAPVFAEADVGTEVVEILRMDDTIEVTGPPVRGDWWPVGRGEKVIGYVYVAAIEKFGATCSPVPGQYDLGFCIAGVHDAC